MSILIVWLAVKLAPVFCIYPLSVNNEIGALITSFIGMNSAIWRFRFASLFALFWDPSNIHRTVPSLLVLMVKNPVPEEARFSNSLWPACGGHQSPVPIKRISFYRYLQQSVPVELNSYQITNFNRCMISGNNENGHYIHVRLE